MCSRKSWRDCHEQATLRTSLASPNWDQYEYRHLLMSISQIKIYAFFSSNASANDQQVQVRGANKTKDKTEKRRTTAHLLQNIPRSATTSSQRHVTRVAGTSIQPKNTDIHRLAPRPTNKVRNGEPRSTPHKSLHSRTTDKLGMIAEANVQYSIEGFAL